MFSFTKVIISLVLLFVNNLDVQAIVEREGRLHNVEQMLINLEAKVKTINDEAKSEIFSLEDSISTFNSSANLLNGKICSMSGDVNLEHIQKIIKQTKNVLSTFEREKSAFSNEIKTDKRWFRKKIKAWKKATGALSSRMNILQIKQKELKMNFQKYDYIVENVTTRNCIRSNDDIGSKLEISEGLLLGNENDTNKHGVVLQCLDGWLLFERYCYYYDKNDERSVSSARDYCRTLNACIADVGSMSESEFIFSLTGDVRTWIGVNDEEKENVWTSERTNQVVAYRNWLPDDPDGGKHQNCVLLGWQSRMYHKWIDAACTNRRHFVCKKEAF